MARDMIEAPADELAYEQALVRSRWTTELRRQGHRKCRGALFRDGKVCALGLLAEIAGFSDADHYYDIGAAAGLSAAQVNTVWKMSDGYDPGFGPSMPSHGFTEIADVVEGWFAP